MALNESESVSSMSVSTPTARNCEEDGPRRPSPMLSAWGLLLAQKQVGAAALHYGKPVVHSTSSAQRAERARRVPSPLLLVLIVGSTVCELARGGDRREVRNRHGGCRPTRRVVVVLNGCEHIHGCAIPAGEWNLAHL